MPANKPLVLTERRASLGAPQHSVRRWRAEPPLRLLHKTRNGVSNAIAARGHGALRICT